MVVNEVSTDGSWHSQFELLKSLISDPKMTIEKKNIDHFNNHPNYLSFIFTTNNINSVKIGRSDRRYVPLETSNRIKGNRNYFNNLYSLFTQEVANHFFTYICELPKTRDIRDIPVTQLKMDMLQYATSPVEQFINELKEEEFKSMTELRNIFDEDSKWEYIVESNLEQRNGNQWIGAKFLFQAYASWANQTKAKIVSSTKFGIEAKQFLESEIRGGKKVYYRIK